MYRNYYNQDNRSLTSGFLGPFILGGITGGLVSPLFYGNNYGYNRPTYYYYQPSPFYGPYPYYRPY